MLDAMDSFLGVIRAKLGTAPEHIEPGRLHRFSTNGKRSDTSGWCKLFDDLRAGVFGDFRSSLSETWTATRRGQMTQADREALQRHIAQATLQSEAAQRDRWHKASEAIARLWNQSTPVGPGDPVYRYLCRRLALDVLAVPRMLRFHPALSYVHEGALVGAWPAMVAPMLDAAGKTVALHRTYLTTDGRKAEVPGPVRKLTPASGLLAGVSIPLSKVRRGVLGVSEGIETALAAGLASSLPTVAAYSAGSLAAYQWPANVRRLVIFADHDPAGAKASANLAARAKRAGLSVEVETPTASGADWCDVWANRSTLEVSA